MKTVITIQHTQSIHHTNGMIGSWTDWDITEHGIQQAENIGKNLAKELHDKAVRIISSDLLRAKHTAEIVAKYFEAKVELDERIRERNLGEACGKSEEWVHANRIIWERTIDDKAFKNSESERDAWIRLEPFFKEILDSKEEAIIIVSHGGTLRQFHEMWLGFDVEKQNNFNILGMSGGVSLLQQKDDGLRRIRKLSDMSYTKL